MIPVLVIGYNRPHLLNNTLKSLSENLGAEETFVHITIDGGGQKANDIPFDAIDGFGGVRIKVRNKNLGLRYNVIKSVNEAMEDKLIVLEDDLIFHKQFLVWMNYFMNNPESIVEASVTGYRRFYPSGGLYVEPDSWSWGTSRRDWDSIDWDMKNYSNQWKSQHPGWHDYALRYKSGDRDIWAIAWVWYHHENRLMCRRPDYNLVEHVGEGGTNVCSMAVEKIYPKQVDRLNEIWNNRIGI